MPEENRELIKRINIVRRCFRRCYYCKRILDRTLETWWLFIPIRVVRYLLEKRFWIFELNWRVSKPLRWMLKIRSSKDLYKNNIVSVWMISFDYPEKNSSIEILVSITYMISYSMNYTRYLISAYLDDFNRVLVSITCVHFALNGKAWIHFVPSTIG